MLQTYALAPETARRALRKTFWRLQGITTLSFIVFGVSLSLFGERINWAAAGPLILVVAIAYFLANFYHYRAQRRYLYSIRVDLDGNSIIFRQAGEPPLRISRADIRRAVQRPDGIWIETRDPRTNMLAPAGLSRDGDATVRAMLRLWTGVEPETVRDPRPQRWLLAAGILGAILILLLVHSLVVIAPLGLALLVAGLLVERRLARTRGEDQSVRRTFNVALSFLLFVIVIKACLITLIR